MIRAHDIEYKLSSVPRLELGAFDVIKFESVFSILRDTTRHHLLGRRGMAGAVIAARGNMRQSKSQKDLNTALEGEVLILRRRLAWLPCHVMLALMQRARF